jgi:hypothetical protein
LLALTGGSGHEVDLDSQQLVSFASGCPGSVKRVFSESAKLEGFGSLGRKPHMVAEMVLFVFAQGLYPMAVRMLLVV